MNIESSAHASDSDIKEGETPDKHKMNHSIERSGITEGKDEADKEAEVTKFPKGSNLICANPPVVIQNDVEMQYFQWSDPRDYKLMSTFPSTITEGHFVKKGVTTKTTLNHFSATSNTERKSCPMPK